MNNVKHTPGPWYWDDRYPMSSTGEKTWSLIGANGYGILSCDGVENSPQGLNAGQVVSIAALMAIRKGDTPETNAASKLALEWAETWLDTQRKAFAS